ncbi:MAG: restriction endonuclease subunit S [Bacteroidales bacterium]|nr:restriction endonuclease subunit S [Bacteroidales bacterium]
MNNWDEVKLDELGIVARGKSKHRPRNAPELYGGKYPFIQTGDIKGAEYYVNKYSQTYSEKGLAQSKLWNKGTLCITIAANIAETAILGIDACFPDSIIGFIPYPKKADVRFVKYQFDLIKKHLQSISQGTTQDNLSQGKLLRFDFKAPLILEQLRIADILIGYDELIETNNRRIAILEQTAEQIYKEWFVRMRFPDYENAVFEKGIPTDWEIKTIKDFGKVVTGKTPSTSESRYYGGKYPFIKTPDMHGNIFALQTEETLSEDGFNSQKSQKLPANSISVSCIGTGGVVAITTTECMTNQQINTIILKDKKALEFLYFACNGLKTMIEMFGSTGATMTNLSKGKFEKLKLIKPSNDLIEDFSKITKSMFSQIRNLMVQQVNLKQTRDLLLPRLISGKLTVKEAEKELDNLTQPI